MSSSLNTVLRRHTRSIIVLLFSTALIAIVVGHVRAAILDGNRELHAYEAAQPCSAAPESPADCIWQQEFTVTDIYLTNVRNKDDSAVLIAEDGTERETYFSSKGPVLLKVDEGGQVTGTLWRGRITEISAHGTTQETTDAPTDVIGGSLAFALVTGPPALLVMVTCVWRLIRHAEPKPTRGMAATLGLAGGLFLAGLFAALMVDASFERFGVLLAVWAGLAALAAVTVYITATYKEAAPGAGTDENN